MARRAELEHSLTAIFTRRRSTTHYLRAAGGSATMHSSSLNPETDVVGGKQKYTGRKHAASLPNAGDVVPVSDHKREDDCSGQRNLHYSGCGCLRFNASTSQDIIGAGGDCWYPNWVGLESGDGRLLQYAVFEVRASRHWLTTLKLKTRLGRVSHLWSSAFCSFNFINYYYYRPSIILVLGCTIN